MQASICILGSNSAMPAHGRHPSAQVLTRDRDLTLIDCGEGCQWQLTRFGIKRNKIARILISHLHGDHIFGLPGLLTSYHHFQRTAPLTIYGPVGLEEVIRPLIAATGHDLPYPLHFVSFDPSASVDLIDEMGLHITTIPLKHRIPTSGFSIRLYEEKRKLRGHLLDAYNLSPHQRSALAHGADIEVHGATLKNEVFTYMQRREVKYAYLSDTLYMPELASVIHGYDMIYHEATFLDALRDKALLTMHTTAAQAANLAKDAAVGRLVIGHYSSRYTDLTPLLDEAQRTFHQTALAIEGTNYEIADRP